MEFNVSTNAELSVHLDSEDELELNFETSERLSGSAWLSFEAGDIEVTFFIGEDSYVQAAAVFYRAAVMLRKLVIDKAEASIPQVETLSELFDRIGDEANAMDTEMDTE